MIATVTFAHAATGAQLSFTVRNTTHTVLTDHVTCPSLMPADQSQSRLAATGAAPTRLATLGFCEEIADHMTENFGISRDEAVARINWHWPGNRRRPAVWIVGMDIAYHQDPASWAAHIYYGRDSFWWLPDTNPTPLPPPPA